MALQRRNPSLCLQFDHGLPCRVYPKRDPDLWIDRERPGRPTGVALTASHIYILNNNIGTIGKYTLAGKPVAVTLAGGLSQPYDIEVSGETLFVTNGGTNSISAFSTSGPVINPYLVVGLHAPCGVAVGEP